MFVCVHERDVSVSSPPAGGEVIRSHTLTSGNMPIHFMGMLSVNLSVVPEDGGWRRTHGKPLLTQRSHQLLPLSSLLTRDAKEERITLR